MNFKNNWIEIPNKDENIIINNYSGYTPKTLLEALRLQAKQICEDFNNITVMVSGGIDSQQAALGFRHFENIRYVFLRIWIDNEYNKTEYLFAKEFAKKYAIELEIFDVQINIQKHLIDYIKQESGLGALLQLYSYKEFSKQNRNSNIVVSTPLMSFHRNGKICSGKIPSPYRGLAQGYDPEKYILFYMYSPTIFKYYEYIHKKTKEIQYFIKFQPKNLAFTELGLPLRAKLNGWEISTENFIENLTLLDFGNDHIVYKHYFLKEFKKNLKINQNNFDKFDLEKSKFKEMTELYSFETTIDI